MLIKASVSLNLLHWGLDVAGEYQAGRLVVCPNLGDGKWKGEVLHSSRPMRSSLGALTAPGAGGSPAGGDRAEGFQLI